MRTLLLIKYFLFLSFFSFSQNNAVTKDTWLIKNNGDSSLTEKTIYYLKTNESIIYSFDNNNDTSMILKYKNGKRTEDIYFLKPYNSYIKENYIYDILGNLIEIKVFISENSTNSIRIFENKYENNIIVRQVIKDVNILKDSNKVFYENEILYKYKGNNLSEKVERILNNNDTIDNIDYFENNKIVKSNVKHSNKNAFNYTKGIWKYDKSGKLKEYIKNPYKNSYEKDIYSYKSNKLQKIKSIIKLQKIKYPILLKQIDYDYYSNDSIKSIITIEKGNISKIKYYYKYFN